MGKIMKRVRDSGLTLPVAITALGLGTSVLIYQIPSLIEEYPKVPVKVCIVSEVQDSGGINRRFTAIREERTVISTKEANEVQASADKKNCHVELCTDMEKREPNLSNKPICELAKTADIGAEIAKDFEAWKKYGEKVSHGISIIVAAFTLPISFCFYMMGRKRKTGGEANP